MPDSLPVFAIPADALIRGLRQPALAGFIARRVIAAGADTERRRVVEACRAELDWARADFIRIAGATRLDLDLDAEGREGVPLWEATRLPHEQAAATALNAWGHLHPP